MSAQAWKFGDDVSTNNAAEVAALLGVMRQLRDRGATRGELGAGVLVLGDS